MTIEDILRRAPVVPVVAIADARDAAPLARALAAGGLTSIEITETEPVVKGQTASSSYKPAMLSNGVRTLVPPHIQAGTRVVIMTEDGSYVERAKD